jgi:oligopeptide transport system permease protein
MLTFLIILLLSFALMQLAPGSPFVKERHSDSVIQEHLMHKYGLDKPWWQQFYNYLSRMIQGDLGPSLKYQQQNVADIIGENLPTTLKVGTLAFLFAIGLAIFGCMIWLWPDPHWVLRYMGKALMGLSFIGILCPSFVLGPILVGLLSLEWHLLPPAGYENSAHLILPVMTLGLIYGSQMLRLLHAQIEDLHESHWLYAARLRGLSAYRIWLWYRFYPAFVPFLSYLGPILAHLWVGSVVVENFFYLPGIGPYFIDAALNRDYFLVMGIVIVESFLLLCINSCVDVLIMWMDPRVRHHG